MTRGPFNTAARPAASRTVGPSLVAARLIRVVVLINKSAVMAYCRETALSDFDWRVLTVAGWNAPLTFTELTARITRDKGQISRAVKRLIAQGLLARGGARAPIVMTPRGRALCDRINRVFDERNAALSRDFTADQLGRLGDFLERLAANAAALLAEEQRRHAPGVDAQDEHGSDLTAVTPRGPSPWRSRNADRFARSITPALAAVLGLMRKSAALTFRRELGLGDFDWRVMSQVGEQAPIELARLVSMMSRDKSQVGRAITRLEAAGLVRRQRVDRGRAILIETTDAGAAIYDRIAAFAVERDRRLKAGFTQREQRALLALIETLQANAEELMRGEQALADRRRPRSPPAGGAELTIPAA